MAQLNILFLSTSSCLFKAGVTSEEEYEELPLIEALNGKMDGASTAELGKPTITIYQNLIQQYS